MQFANQKGFTPILILPVFLVLALLIIGTMWWFRPLQKITVSIQNPVVTTSPQPSIETISSIADALTKSIGRGIKCTRIPKSESTPPGTSYIKDGKLRMEGGNEGLMMERTVTGLFVNNTLWIWEPNSQVGHKVVINPKDTEMNVEVIAKGLDEYKQNCRYAEIDPNLFMLPEDVEFKEY